jgi:hypothetical protein
MRYRYLVFVIVFLLSSALLYQRPPAPKYVIRTSAPVANTTRMTPPDPRAACYEHPTDCYNERLDPDHYPFDAHAGSCYVWSDGKIVHRIGCESNDALHND